MASFIQQRAAVLANRRLARDTFLIRLHAPELARAIRPGQFVMLRSATGSDPLLGRPFALYDTVLDERGAPIGIDVVYLVVGKLTRLLSQLGDGERAAHVVSGTGGQSLTACAALQQSGDHLEVWGPLGNGFPEPTTSDHVGLVA